MVCVPSHGSIMPAKKSTGRRMVFCIQTGSEWRMRLVRTQPGCTLTAVTPEPSSRFASDFAWSTLASLDCA